jgi:hypothetical protein
MARSDQTLACTLVYSASVIVSNIAHGWTEKSASRSSSFRLPPQVVSRGADETAG